RSRKATYGFRSGKRQSIGLIGRFSSYEFEWLGSLFGLEVVGDCITVSNAYFGLVVPVAILTIAGIILAIILWRQKKKRKNRKPEAVENLTSINDALDKGIGPRRGYLPDLDVVITVKMISRRSKQGKKEYIIEVKFMPNGSLDFHLFGNKALLSWVVRYKISLGLASAILYLHEEWEQLMDYELGPKTTGLAVTLGYLAPEYVNTGRANKELDIYSFGVVLLEIAIGRKSIHRIQDFEMGLVAWVWDLYGKGKLLSVVDEKPSIKQVTQARNFEIEQPNLPTKMPIAMYVAPTKLV
ncbi:hypothetical protein Golax_014798, partial [Gossypium laxum]|nr:hypothetical protein [Gossypium laxum]